MPSAGALPKWDLADRLSKSLHHRGMKVQDMADYLGVSRNTIGNYLARRTMPDRRTLLLWSMKTGLPVEWLETGEPPSVDPDGGGEPVRRGRVERPTRWFGGFPSHAAVPRGTLDQMHNEPVAA